jgi:hypothetical protein
MLVPMSTRRRHTKPALPSRQKREAPHPLHARLSVRPKDFVDFCEVPELGDVTDQDVLWLDQKPIVRGSPRRVRELASQLTERLCAQDALGRSARPMLCLERVQLEALGTRRAEFDLQASGELFCVHAFHDLTVTIVVDGQEKSLEALPLIVRAPSRVSVLVNNPHDVPVSGDMVLVFDLTTRDAPASCD